MKKIVLKTTMVILISLLSLSLYAKDRVVERVYFNTDREYYLAGESIFLSLFLFQLSEEGDLELSNFSKVAYFELHNSRAPVAVQKIASNGGRGGGEIELPINLPTGNYKLIAYTKQMLNEEKLLLYEKVIPIYNTISGDFIEDGVEIIKESKLKATSSHYRGEKQSDLLDLSVKKSFIRGDKGELILSKSGSEELLFSISISREDLISSKIEPETITSFRDGELGLNNVRFTDRFMADYEGEVISVAVKSKSSSPLVEDVPFYLSAVGDNAQLYVAFINKEKSLLRFNTASLLGNPEVALYYGADDIEANKLDILYTFIDPYAKPKLSNFPTLEIDTTTNRLLLDRSIEMQINRRFGVDTLFYQYGDIFDDPFLSREPISYRLNDYNRFSTMDETVLEFISELRFRRVDGKPKLMVRKSNLSATFTYVDKNILTLLDGIPIFDHKIIYDLDPYKLEVINIYPWSFSLGRESFEAIVVINSFKRNYLGLSFPNNYSISDYQGVDYPVLYRYNKEAFNNEAIPHIQTLLYWNPLLSLADDKDHIIRFLLPSIIGRYQVKIEGVTKSGEPFEVVNFFDITE